MDELIIERGRITTPPLRWKYAYTDGENLRIRDSQRRPIPVVGFQSPVCVELGRMLFDGEGWIKVAMRPLYLEGVLDTCVVQKQRLFNGL